MPTAPESFQYDAFLSYSSEDSAIVHPLAEKLRHAGLKVWLDATEIPAGGDIFAAIEIGLQQSRVCVACMSPAYFASQWTQLERNTSTFRDPMNVQRRFVPLLLKECDIPDTVRRLKYLDFRQQTEEAFEQIMADFTQPEAPPQDELALFESKALSLGHTEPVTSVAISNDGSRAVSGSGDLTVRVWNLNSGHCTATLEGHSGYVTSVAISNDGSRALSGSEDASVRIWDLHSGHCTATLKGHSEAVRSVATSHDGSRALSGSDDKTVRVWDLNSAQCTATLEGHSEAVRSVAINHDGSRALSGSDDKTIRVWDLKSGQAMATLKGHSEVVRSVAISRDGSRALSGSDDKTIRVWDLNSGHRTTTLEGHSGRLRSVAISSDGCHALSGSSDNAVRVWDLKSGQCTAALEGHSDFVMSVAISNDGSRAISGSTDTTVRVWDLHSGQCEEILKGHSRYVRSMVISHDGSRALSGSEDNTVRIWDLNSGHCTATLEGQADTVWSVAISRDGSRALSGSEDRTVRVWDLNSGRCTAKLEGHSRFVRSVAISSDGSRAISASGDNTVRVWDLNTGQNMATLEGHSDVVWSVAISSDGSRAISASGERVRVWDLNSSQCKATLEAHSDLVTSVAISNDGSLALSGSLDKTVCVWDLNAGQRTATFEGHSDAVRSVAISNDGSRGLSGSQDKTIRVWDLNSGQCKATLAGHSGPVWSVAMSSDGNVLYSVATNGVLRIWSPDTDYPKQIVEPGRKYTNAKVVLVGDSGVGKSGLAHRLIEDKFVETHSTHGMHVWRIDLPVPDDDDTEREALLWDLAGQPDYRLIHQLFLDETTLALILIDPQQDDPFAPAIDWCRVLENCVKSKCVRLLIAARIDVGTTKVGQAKINRFLQDFHVAEYLGTSARRGDNCSDRQAEGPSSLKQRIAHHIPWSSMPYTSTPKQLAVLKNAVLDMTELDDVRLLRFNELYQRLQQQKPKVRLDPQLVRDAASLLSNHGLVMPLAFGDLVLLRPNLLNGYCSSVINAARANKDEIGSVVEDEIYGGCIDFSQVDRLEDKDEQLLLRAMVQTLLEKSLCLKEQIDGRPHLIFPSQYRRERTYPTDPQVFVSYTFTGELQSIYTTLVVRLWYSREFDNQELWKDAAEFRTHDGGLAGFLMNRLGDGAATLCVFFDDNVTEQQKAIFLEFIHQHLKKYSSDLQRDRRYVCLECGEPVANAKAVRIRLAKGLDQIGCQFCDESVPLVDSIEATLASDPVARKVLEMDETAGIELSNQALEQILIGHMLTICGNANQIFRPTVMADYGIDGEVEFRDTQGNASGRKIYVQLKCGGSHLRHRKHDDNEVFDAETRHLEYWVNQPVDVYLVIRDAEKKIRWMNVSQYLRDREDKKSRQIIFGGNQLDTEELWLARDRHL
ncbi:TIR domain-containing protein [Fuerstiella marisgermanici]|uniref:PQQ-dependent catabolism-associated beta-propeller protein n=1 Tax=Fuerstiella marisgermanici TaxID=1891926 RepID=A0A1P8WRT6_9PLAN|nr:TIR domain-containing protein [Fuerstiella marisgermanici]APZ96748.1 PQQ-dependent catabolism-associated beta-propeller protein [Fuerstiella marisgermanici]